MKVNTKIVVFMAIIMLFTLFFTSFATEEITENVTENLNTGEGNTTQEDLNTNNENTSNQTNFNTVGNNEVDPNTTGNSGSGNNNSNLNETTKPNNNSNSENPNQSSHLISTSTQPGNATIESSDNNLKYLAVDVEGLLPEFSNSITDYYLIVGLDVQNIEVQALAEDAKASVTIVGNKDLQEGENTIQIIVKAENGNIKTYFIHVTKTDDVDGTNANLKTLTIDKFKFYPKFKPTIYYYSLTINEMISKLDMLVETENEEARYEIVGNDNLKEGDNLIKIIVTAKNGEAKREYKINAYISTKSVQNQKTNRNQAVVILAVLGVAIIGISYTLYKRKQKK